MKVPINLATRPYENLRPLSLAIRLLAALAVVLALLVVWNVRRSSSEARTLTEQTDQLTQDMKALRTEQGDLERWLARPEVQAIQDRSAFLNSLILRKSLSWTQMFMDLEKILPERVEVTSIRPGLGDSQQADLKLTVAAPTVEPLVEFLKNLESSSQFGPPVVDSQRFPAEKATDPNILLDLSVEYHQRLDLPAPAAPASASAASVSPRDIQETAAKPARSALTPDQPPDGPIALRAVPPAASESPAALEQVQQAQQAQQAQPSAEAPQPPQGPQARRLLPPRPAVPTTRLQKGEEQ